MKEEKLVDNVRDVGAYLGELLHEYLDVHQNVGNVRGRGLFWGVSEFLKLLYHQATNTPLDRVRG